MMAQPTASIPVACRGWNETQAAYRFFDNVKVTAEPVLLPHQQATLERIKQHERVLCIQDTTELDFSDQTQTTGLGPLNYEARQGLYLHPTLAIMPERVPLGILDSLVWARDAVTHGDKTVKTAQRPIEEKESYRWIEGYRPVCTLADQVPQTRLTYLVDREGDIYELLREAKTQDYRADYLIRCAQDRAVLDEYRLSETLVRAPVLGEIEFTLPSTHDRKQKHMTQPLKAVRVTLRPPPSRA